MTTAPTISVAEAGVSPACQTRSRRRGPRSAGRCPPAPQVHGSEWSRGLTGVTSPACHHRGVNEEGLPLRIDPDDAGGSRLRIRLDWRTFAYLVVAILGALAVIAVFRGTETMLTRIGVGLVIALALDPLTNAVGRGLGIRRGLAVGIVALGVFGLAALLIVVLAPRAVTEASKFSEQLPDTINELEQLPLVGGYLRDNEIAEKAQQWVRELPEQFTDERVAEVAGTLVSGVASVAIVVVVAIAVLIDGEYLLARMRRLLTPPRRAQADYVGG